MAEYPLITLAEAKRELGFKLSDGAKDVEVQDAIDAASLEIENFLGRHLISRGTLTEYHTFRVADSELYVRVLPIISVTEVAEDTNRVYGASTLLTVDTDYIVSKPAGKLIRVSGASASAWLTGFRSIRLQYDGGHAASTDIPSDIRKVCREYMALIYRESEREEHGRISISSDFGTMTKFGPVELSAAMKRRLSPYRDFSFSRTWERDA